jgi:branched-chain amino acid transport system ATP-binding protein
MLLEIHDLHVYYGHIHAVKGISLYVRQGEIVTLIGANGAGKSTTLMAIAGAIPSQRSEILLEEMDITHMSMGTIARLGVNLVPEGRRIFPDFTVDENLRVGSYGVKDPKKIKDLREKVYTLFPRLKERLKQIGGTLSGGEQQMLAIARGLMSDPRILLLDEPSLGLAPILMDDIFEHIQEIHRQGTTILLVEQNAQLALQIADRGYVLETGKIVLEGTAEELQHNDMVRHAYLGIG